MSTSVTDPLVKTKSVTHTDLKNCPHLLLSSHGETENWSNGLIQLCLRAPLDYEKAQNKPALYTGWCVHSIPITKPCHPADVKTCYALMEFSQKLLLKVVI